MLHTHCVCTHFCIRIKVEKFARGAVFLFLAIRRKEKTMKLNLNSRDGTCCERAYSTTTKSPFFLCCSHHLLQCNCLNVKTAYLILKHSQACWRDPCTAQVRSTVTFLFLSITSFGLITFAVSYGFHQQMVRRGGSKNNIPKSKHWS